MDPIELESFIVTAKLATYAGDAPETVACRRGSHDIAYTENAWTYLDSYFGGTDFAGQEVVWLHGDAVWAMNYRGTVLRPELIDATRSGTVIKAALSALYREERRFIGKWEFSHEFGLYRDVSSGDVSSFSGREEILVGSVCAFELLYHGGLVTP